MRIASIDYALGGQQETWAELKSDNPDWNLELLAPKCGVDLRHVATPEQTALDLATAAGSNLLAQYDCAMIDGLVYVTQSPDSSIPATACLLHERLALPKTAFAFDVDQGCSGYVYGLAIASSLLDSTGRQSVLLVCSETYRKYIAPDNRACRPIFSDGASATLLVNDGQGNIGPFVFATDGAGASNLTLRPSSKLKCGQELFMDGQRVMMFTMGAVPKATASLLDKAGLAMETIDLFVYHQASAVVLDNIQRRLNIPDDRFLRYLQGVGNTVSSTIPIALKHAYDSKRLQQGMTVLLMGFGVGYSLAGCILRT